MKYTHFAIYTDTESMSFSYIAILLLQLSFLLKLQTS